MARAFWSALDRSEKAGGVVGAWGLVWAADRVVTASGMMDPASIAVRNVATVKRSVDAGADPRAVEAAISLGLAMAAALSAPAEAETEAVFAESRKRLRLAKAQRSLGAREAAAAKTAKWKPWAEERFRDIRARRPGLSAAAIATIIQDGMEAAHAAGAVAKVVEHRAIYDHVRALTKNDVG